MTKFKNKLIFTLVLVLLVVAFSIVSCAEPEPEPAPEPGPTPAPEPEPTPAPEPIELGCISFYPIEDAGGLYSWRLFKDAVNERAGGELVLSYLGGSEVMPIVEATEAIRSGVLDMAVTSGPYVSSVVPEALSLILTKNTPLEQRDSGYYDLLAEAFKEKMNTYYLGRNVFYQYGIYTVNPLETIADLEGKKFRVVPSYEPFYRELGIVGVTMPLGEAYTGLERGVVEGVTIPVDAVHDFKWYEVLNYKIDADFWMCDPILVMNMDKWNSLPEHLQDLMNQVALEVEETAYTYFLEQSVETWETLKGLGMTEIKWSDADTEKLMDVVYSSTWDWVEQEAGAEVTDKLKAAAE